MERIEQSPCKQVFEYFREMNQIPRGSGNEKAVSDWLVKFAKDRNLEVIQDEALNVIIRKPATAGYENAEAVILQGHMDMVPEKGEGSNHDFTKDPIAFIVDGDFVHADNTTLGADNGIAVAYALAILDSKDIPHPALEVLVTSNEETGMDGAFALKPENLKSRRLINIDSEVEGELLVSCAGGIGSVTSLKIEKEAAPAGGVKEITVTGLFGGHSGMEINKQRGNAVQILGRMLNDLTKELDYKLISVNGGSKHNAIPRNAVAKIHAAEGSCDTLKAFAEKWTKILKNELHGIDDDVEIKLNCSEEKVDQVMTDCTRAKVLALLTLTPIGVINMSFDIPGLVQTSNNLGIVITEDDKVTFESATRSSVRSMKFEVADRLAQLAKLAGAEIEFDSGYPEWQFKQDSKLRDTFVEVYTKQYGHEPKINAIHAGLECGLFSEKFDGNIDLISFGPNLFDVHTPKEKMEIASVERTFELLKGALAALK